MSLLWGKALKMIRGVRGWNQEQASSFYDLSQGYYSMLEHNKRDPSVATLCQIADALKVPVWVLTVLATEGVPPVVLETAKKEVEKGTNAA